MARRPNVKLAAAEDTEAQRRAEEALTDRLRGFIAKMESEAQRRVDRRGQIERRWIQDLRQYHGLYEFDVAEKLRKAKRSEIFINSTATKTDALEARLWDLLFPTDDRNWKIGPTPVPELARQTDGAARALEKATEAADGARAEAQRLMDDGDVEGAQAAEVRMRGLEQVESEAQAESDRLQEIIREAEERADLMQKEIDDQFVTCNYPAEARDAISDACKIGLGVLKGPVVSGGGKMRWAKRLGQDGADVYELVRESSRMPGVQRVDPWSFFPDPDVKKIEDMDGILERHLMNKKQLRAMAREPGMNLDAIREIIRSGSTISGLPNNLTELYDLTGQTQGAVKDMFQVWEFTGAIDYEDLETLYDAFDRDMPGDMDIDPLAEFHVRLWFCQGHVLKFALHPLDSNEPIYSCFTIRPDETSVFGFGVPYIMRHPQSVLNGAFRMMMDNSGLSTGPQIVINKNMVEPENSNWNLEPSKVWTRKSSSVPGEKPFETFNIESNQQELANIIEIAEMFIDDVTAMPKIAQGEQGTGITKTAQGMALLMNSANVIFRRIVRSFDDDMTTPLVRRFYHWNMQFSEKDAIKGDHDVKATGSSVLLVREMQAQNLLMIAQLFGDHPVYGPMLRHQQLLRQIFRAHMISADEITKTDQEYKKFLADQQQNPPPEIQAAMIQQQIADAERALREKEMQSKVEIANMENDTKLRLAGIAQNTALEKAAGDLNVKAEDSRAKMADKAADRDQKDRSLAVEVAMKQRTGESSGGAV